jgi:hypothetical protein
MTRQPQAGGLRWSDSTSSGARDHLLHQDLGAAFNIRKFLVLLNRPAVLHETNCQENSSVPSVGIVLKR